MASSREEVPATLSPRTEEGAKVALGASCPSCLADRKAGSSSVPLT